MVADLPVGENLQDQVIGDGVEFFTPYQGVSISMHQADSLFSGWSYDLFGTGVFPLMMFASLLMFASNAYDAYANCAL